MSSKNGLRQKAHWKQWLTGVTAAIALVVSAFVAVLNVTAADSTYNITYINGSVAYTKNYTAGSVVTLDTLPSGAIAWTDDSSTVAPNHKMAYVDYSHTNTENNTQVQVSLPPTLTINSNMTLTANYGSYATGQGPRMVQYHLELKFFDMTTNQMMQYEQHYVSINAPAGYYIQLPPSNYFGNSLYADVNSSGNLTSTGQTVSDWANDGSYTGTTNEPQSNIFAPNALIYVDPNNYNMIYDAMVTPSIPPPPATPDTITFRISQANIPPASICQDLFTQVAWRVCGGSFWLPWGDNQSGAAWYVESGLYIMAYSGQTQLMINDLQDTTTWNSALPQLANTALGSPLPFAVVYPNYDYYWTMDGTRLPTTNETDTINGTSVTFDTTLANYLNGAGVSPQDAIGGSHVFTLYYVPKPATVQLYIDGHTDSVVYDGNSHLVSGYDVYDCSAATTIDQDNLLGSGCTLKGASGSGEPVTLPNGDVLSFTNTSGNSNVTATGTDVGTYPITLAVGDFSVTNTSGDLYNLTMSNGGLTITQKTLPIVVTPPIDPDTPGNQTVVVTPTDPNDLAPGHEIITPGTGITNNGDGTSTTDGNTNVVVNVDGDGNITYIDPKTGQPIPYDPTLPNGGVVWVGDTNNTDPNTGLPSNVTNNYDPSKVLPTPVKKPGSGNSGGSGGVIIPGAPSTGIRISYDLTIAVILAVVVLAIGGSAMSAGRR